MLKMRGQRSLRRQMTNASAPYAATGRKTTTATVVIAVVHKVHATHAQLDSLPELKAQKSRSESLHARLFPSNVGRSASFASSMINLRSSLSIFGIVLRLCSWACCCCDMHTARALSMACALAWASDLLNPSCWRPHLRIPVRSTHDWSTSLQRAWLESHCLSTCEAIPYAATAQSNSRIVCAAKKRISS